jgi:filamentous hemagglutinin family protein
MAHGRAAAGSVALVGVRRRSRAALLRGTALQAAAWVVVAAPAAAQLSPAARPTGGQVAAGRASIGGNATTTLVTQRSQGAIINWQSYNVGSAQTVRYAQPNSSALALNRVLGPNPSEIAGHIDANGQIIIVNQSGVVFDRGSQVNTAGLVASTAGMTNRNFLAGRMVLDQAGRPGARVVNAGNITVRQAGLAALVAPQVANSGTISAQLGHVMLAGGEAATLDLYGDRLVSLNVTRAVHTVSLGGQAVSALVTNTGTLLAPGGTLVLTARDADAVVTNLVQAGGTIAADTQGNRRGSVLVQGVGGSVQIDGTVSVSGTAVGQRGGTVAIAASDAVTVGSAAQVTASGYAGGGQIVLGTARHHGSSRGTAQGVTIAQGAAVRADATGSGNGGRISVLSQDTIGQSGALSARGAGGGSGGNITLSGSGALTISGLEDTGAAAGQAGQIQVSSNLVEITNNKPDPGYTAISTRTVDAMTGDVTVSAGHTLKLLSNVVLGTGATGFNLQAGTLLVLSANWNAGSLGGVFSSGSGGIVQTAGVITAGSLNLQSTGAVRQTGGSLNLGTLLGRVGGASLTGANKVSALGALTTTGDFTLDTAGALTVGGALAGGSHNITLTGASVTIADAISTTGTVDLIAAGGNISEIRAGVIDAGALAGSAAAGGGLPGSALLGADNKINVLNAFKTSGDFELTDIQALTVGNSVASTGGNVTLDVTAGQGLTIDAGVSAAGTLSLTAGGSMVIGGVLSGTQIALLAGTAELPGGNITETGAGAIDAGNGTGTLGATAVGSIVLNSTANHIGTVSTLLARSGGVTLDDANSLTVAGTVSAASGAVTLAASNPGGPAAGLTIDGSISGTAVVLSATGTVSEAAKVVVDATAGPLSLQAGSGITFAGVLASGTLVTSGDFVTGLAGGGGVTLGTFLGDIAETGAGTLGAATLAASSGGALLLAPGGTAQNWIETIGNLNTRGGAAIADLTGPCLCGIGTVGGALLVTVAPGGGPLVLAATMNAGSADLIDAAGIEQTGGALTTTTGTLALDAASGAIVQQAGATLDAATLLSLTAGGSSSFPSGSRFSLVNGIDLAGLAAGGDIALTADAGSIIENTATGVLKTGGTLTAVAHATGGLYGDIDLSSAANAIAVLGTSHADATLLLRDAAALTVSGTVYGAQGIGITDTGAANGISIAGTLQTGTPTVVTSGSASWSVYSGAIILAAGGAITEDQGGTAVGVIRTGTLAASSGGATQLDTATNAIGTLGAVSLVAATDASTLTGNGIVVGTTVRIFDTTFQGGTVSAGPSLVVATQVTSTGGDAVYLAAPTLTILGSATSTGGSILLQANTFDLAGPVSTGTAGLVAFDLLTPGALTLTGLGSDSFAGAGLGAVRTLRLDIGSLADPAFLMAAAPTGGHVQSITISAPLDLTGIAGTLGLFAQGAIDATAPVTVGALFGAGGSATLNGATNDVGTLGSFHTSNGLVFDDAVSLLVADGARLDGGAGGIAIDVTDPAHAALPLLTLGTTAGATLTAAGAVSLTADGGVTQNGGQIVSDTQSVTVTTAGDITQLNGGTLSAATNAALAAGGGIGFAGLLSAGNAVLLSAGGGITENPGGGGASGRIDTGTLAAGAGGSIDLAGMENAFGTVAPLQSAASGLALAGLTAGGAIYVIDSESLTLANAAVSAVTGIEIHLLDVAGAAIGTLSQNGGSISVTGGTAGTVTLQALAMAQNAGTVTAPGSVNIDSATLVQSGGAITSSGGSVSIAGALTQSGASQVTAAQIASVGGALNQTVSSLTGTAGVSVTGAAVQSGGTITAADGAVSLGSTLDQTGGSIIAGLTVSAGGAVTQASSSLTGTDGVGITGGVSQTDGTITAANGRVVVIGADVIQAGASSIAGGAGVALALSGNMQQAAGSMIAAAGGPLVIDSSGGAINIGGTLRSAGAMLLYAGGGDIAETSGNGTNGQIVAGTLAAGATGAIMLDAAGTVQNQIVRVAALSSQVPSDTNVQTLSLKGLTAASNVELADGIGLVIADGSLVQAASGHIGIDVHGANAPGLTIGTSQGATVAAAQSVSLQVDGAMAQTGGSISAVLGGVGIVAGGDVRQAGAVMQGKNGLSVRAGGRLVSQASTLAAGAGTVFVSANGGIAFDGLIESGGATGADGVFVPSGSSSVLLYSAGDIADSAGGGATGRILAGTLVAVAGGGLNLADTGNSPATGNQVAHIGAQGGLESVAGNVDFTDQANLTVQSGAVVSGGGTVELAIGDMPGGTAFGLTLDPGGSVLAGGGVTISAASVLQAAGSTIRAGGPIDVTAAGAETLAGTLSTADAISLDAASIAAGAAMVDAGVLAARATGTIDIGNTANRIGTIGVAGALAGLSAGGAITIGDGESLAIDSNVRSRSGAVDINGRQDVSEAQGVSMQAATSLQILAPDSIFMAGALTAPRIVLGDAATQLVTWAASTIRTGSNLPTRIDAQTLMAPLTGSQPGVFVTAANFRQTGTATVLPLDGPQATMQLTITGTGAATFEKLYAPSTQLLLSLLRGGSAKGRIDVAGLNVFFTPGLKPRIPTLLTGRVGKYTGTAAAGAGFSHARANINYQVNGCPIQSLNCVLLSPVVVPVVDPVQDYFVGTTRHRHDDDDALPNVGEADY